MPCVKMPPRLCVLKSCARASCTAAAVCVRDVGCVKRASAFRLSCLDAPFHSVSRRMCASGSASPVFPLPSLPGPHLSPRRSPPSPWTPGTRLFLSSLLRVFHSRLLSPDPPDCTKKGRSKIYPSILVRATNLLEDQPLNPEKASVKASVIRRLSSSDSSSIVFGRSDSIVSFGFTRE